MPVTTFTIDRALWLRGTGQTILLDDTTSPEALAGLAVASFLLRPADHKRCCVGIYLQACGLADEVLFGRTAGAEIAHALPAEADWLVLASKKARHPPVHSAVASTLYALNDERLGEGLAGRDLVNEHDREKRIAEIFDRQGITVTFTGDDAD